MSSHPKTEILERFALDFVETHELAALRTHVAECASCSAQVESFRAEGAAIAKAAKGVKLRRIERPMQRIAWKPWLVAGAAAAVLLLGFGVMSVQNEAPPPPCAKADTKFSFFDTYAIGPSETQGGTPLSGAEHSIASVRDVTADYKNALVPTSPDPVCKPDPTMQPPVRTTPNPEKPKEPPAAMTFQGYGVNPFILTADQKLSTFALDVDTASYTVVRRYLEQGQLPPPEAVRVEEFINYFKYDYPQPKETFGVTVEASPSRFAKGRHLVRIAIRAKDVGKDKRTPAVLTFVVDVSGSMAQENRLGLVKKSLALLVNELQEGDLVGIVIYGSESRVTLEHTGDKKAILAAIDALETNGSTNVEAGLRVGYGLAAKSLRKESINRVILCSDGVANVGETGPEAILKIIEEERAKGITLTTVGFGMGNFNDVLMEKLANKGNGSYHYVDQLKEARRIFVENLTSTLQTVAMDAKVQVEFDPAIVKRYRQIGYENRGLKNEDFRNDKVDAGEVGAGHRVTALYEVELTDETLPHRLVKATMRYREPNSKEHIEVIGAITRGEIKEEFKKTTASYQLAAVAAAFAEVLRNSDHVKGLTLEEIYGEARRVAEVLNDREDVKELSEMIRKAMTMRK